MIACTTGQTDIVKLLVSRGASWKVTNKVNYCNCNSEFNILLMQEGLMPIDIARKEGHTQIEEYLAGLGRI